MKIHLFYDILNQALTNFLWIQELAQYTITVVSAELKLALDVSGFQHNSKQSYILLKYQTTIDGTYGSIPWLAANDWERLSSNNL